MAESNTPEGGFQELVRKSGSVSLRWLDDFYDGLRPVTVDELIGEWRLGFILTEGTGSRLETLVRYSPILPSGKRFLSKNKVQAWIFSFFGIRVGLPGASAVLEAIAYRDKVSTSMIYNYLPIIDHFRKVGDRRIMGITEVKGRLGLYFYMTERTQI